MRSLSTVTVRAIHNMRERGATIAEIAAELKIGVRTVNKYLSRGKASNEALARIERYSRLVGYKDNGCYRSSMNGTLQPLYYEVRSD